MSTCVCDVAAAFRFAKFKPVETNKQVFTRVDTSTTKVGHVSHRRVGHDTKFLMWIIRLPTQARAHITAVMMWRCGDVEWQQQW